MNEREEERMSGLKDQHEDTGLCTCGVLISDCDDAYAHITGGAWWKLNYKWVQRLLHV
jgi:hypothetical protein